MLDDYTRGGQIFIHKIRMFRQVILTSTFWSFVIGTILVFFITLPKYKECDLGSSKIYLRAIFIDYIWSITPKNSDDSKRKEPSIDIYNDKTGSYSKSIKVSKVLNNLKYRQEFIRTKNYILDTIQYALIISTGLVVAIFLIWSKFGKNARTTKHLSGSTIKTAEEVRKYLKSRDFASEFTINNMPLIKDMETRHILVTGSTGSGKTNLFNTMLPQIRLAKQPALIIDQTGEMIERYYDPKRGDIIFNPLDARSHGWDFWKDATSDNTISEIDTRLEKFAKILFGFGKKNNIQDPFWQNSAETIFIACVQKLLMNNNKSIKHLKDIILKAPYGQLKTQLKGTQAERYFGENNKTTAESILSVMTTSAKPLNLLFDHESKFSLKDYFQGVSDGKDAWLFLSAAPSQREVTLPLLACIMELAVSYLIEIGINEKRRIWFLIDELASLGRLNALVKLLPESRKYGGCVLAATQSINQLHEYYGQYGGNVIFDQFATKFIFRSTDPSTARIISEIFGHVEYAAQQKNTSYGAHEHRDGVSYTEQEKRKTLITAGDIASLENLECYVGFPEPNIRIAKIKVPFASNILRKNQGYIPQDMQVLYKQVMNEYPKDKELTAETEINDNDEKEYIEDRKIIIE